VRSLKEQTIQPPEQSLSQTDAAARDPSGSRTREDDTDGLDEARAALDAALDKKALEPILLDVRALCSYTSYILLVSGRSDRQVEAISDAVVRTLRERGLRPLGVEGTGAGQWALLDFGDVIVHVFHHPVREHYDLEGLWNEAARVAIEVPADARIPAEDAYSY
jgi:ribosome-associated protein